MSTSKHGAADNSIAIALQPHDQSQVGGDSGKDVLKKWFVAHIDDPYLDQRLKRKLSVKSGLPPD